MATILVVDDDSNTCQLYVSLLTPFGHQVLQASDGRGALSVAQDRHLDLVVSDILMPTMNGYEFVSSLRKLPRHEATKIVFHSASFLDHESRSLGLSCGVEHFISKPCDPEKILETVNQVLGLPAAPVPPVVRDNGGQDQISLLVDRVYEKGQQFDVLSARLSAIVEFGIHAAQLNSPEALLESALAAARKILGANFAGGGFIAKNQTSLAFSCFRVAGMEPWNFPSDEADTGSAFQRIVNNGEVLRAGTNGENTSALHLPKPHPPVGSFLGMPIRTASRAYGLMYVADKLGGGEFTAHDERLLGTIAARVGIGYENISREQNLQQQMLRLQHEVHQRQQAEDRFRLLVETSPMGILLCNFEGRITEANPHLQRMFGYSRSELVGSPVEMLVPEGHRAVHAGHRSDYVKAPLTRAMGQGMELYARRKDGTSFPVEISLGPITGSDQPMISSTVVDITARKKLEEQLRVAQRLEAVGQLAAGIAHDFNNILTAISGNTKLALADLPTGHPVQQNLEEIEKAASRATGVVRQILSFSRQDPVKREPIAIAKVVEEAIRLARTGLRANISVETNFAADLPAVFADSTQIHQIVMNLATNAADAIGDKPGILSVQLRAEQLDAADIAGHPGLAPGYYVRLSVSDSGCGMDERTASRIFEPFFTTKPLGHGTGLGLSVVHGIVQQHGGAITVDSKVGRGTTFLVYLPAASQAADRLNSEQGEVPHGHGENILYVDDEEPLVFLATRMLERLGYQVTGCVDPEKALAVFRANPKQFDAVVSDVAMPGMSGTDLARELLQIRPGLPIVLTSGYIRPQDEESARELGLPELVLKPDTVDQLGRILSKLSMKSISAGAS